MSIISLDTKTHLASCIPPMHFQQPHFHTFLPLCTCPLMFIISTQATRYPIVTIGHATMCISLRYLRFQAPISGTSWPPEKGDTRIRVACGKRNDTKTLPGLGSLAPFDPVLATGRYRPGMRVIDSGCLYSGGRLAAQKNNGTRVKKG